MRRSLITLTRRRLVVRPAHASPTRFNSSSPTSRLPAAIESLRSPTPPAPSQKSSHTTASEAVPHEELRNHIQDLLSREQWREAEAALHLTPIPDTNSAGFTITLEQLTQPLYLGTASTSDSSKQDLELAPTSMLLVHYLTQRGMHYEALMVLEQIIVQQNGIVHAVEELSALARGLVAQSWSTIGGGNGAVGRQGAEEGEVGSVAREGAAGDGDHVDGVGESSLEERFSLYAAIRLTHLLLIQNIQFYLLSPDKTQLEVIPHILVIARKLTRLPPSRIAHIFSSEVDGWEEWVRKASSVPGVRGMDINDLLSGSSRNKGSLASALGAQGTSPHDSAYTFVYNAISTTSPTTLKPTRLTRSRVFHLGVYADEHIFPIPISLVNHSWHWSRDQWERLAQLLIEKGMPFEAMGCLERKRITNLGLWGSLVTAVKEGLGRSRKKLSYKKLSAIYAASRLVHFRNMNEGSVVKFGPSITRGTYAPINGLSKLIPPGEWFAPSPSSLDEAEVEDEVVELREGSADSLRTTKFDWLMALLQSSEEVKVFNKLLDVLLSVADDPSLIGTRPPIERVIIKRFIIPNRKSLDSDLHDHFSPQDNELHIPMNVYTILIKELVKRRMFHRAACALQAVIQGDVGTIPEKRRLFELVAGACFDGVWDAKEEDMERYTCVNEAVGEGVPPSHDTHIIKQSLNGIAKLAYLANKRKLPTGDITTLLISIKCVLSRDFKDLAPIGMNKYLHYVTKRLITHPPDGVLLQGGGARWGRGKDRYGNRKEFKDVMLGEGCWYGYMPRLSDVSLYVLRRMCAGCLGWEEGVGKVTREIANREKREFGARRGRVMEKREVAVKGSVRGEVDMDVGRDAIAAFMISKLGS